MMKKPIYIIAACALSTAVLCGCGAKATEAQSYEQPTIPRMTRESESDQQFDRREIIIELDGNINRLRKGLQRLRYPAYADAFIKAEPAFTLSSTFTLRKARKRTIRSITDLSSGTTTRLISV